MRVCLVNPSSSFLLDDRVFPPLGLLRVAASLEKRGIPVEVVSGSSPIPPATHYGISATTAQMPETMRLLPSLTHGKVILGGAHATMVSAASKRGSDRAWAHLYRLLFAFDTVVAGDGEEAIHSALHTYGLVDADDPHSPLYAKEQDSLPLPARHLIDLSSYHYEIDGKSATSLVTQLGCPFGCRFCGGRSSSFYRRVRSRSVNTILSEIAHLHHTYGYEAFMFFDDELNVSPQMPALMQELADYQCREGVSFSMRGFIKASLFNEVQAESLREAGFREILIGFESGDDRILKNIGKGTVADNTRAMRVAKSAGLRVKALCSIGHPGESSSTVRATKDWILSSSPDEFDITIITPYPGTPYWDEAVRSESDPLRYTYTAKNGDHLYMNDVDYSKDANYYKGVPGSYISYVSTDELSESDLVTERDRLEKEVRSSLSIPYPSPTHFDHSMGQTGRQE